MKRSQLLFAAFLIGPSCVASLTVARPAWAESLSATIADTRTTLALRVKPTMAQRWLPKPWVVRPVAKGPFKGANLLVVLIDRLLHRDASGKPAAGGSYRMAVLLIPAVDPESKRTAPFIVRVYSPQGAPGPYRNSLKAAVKREAIQRRDDDGPGAGTERWTVVPAMGGSLVFAMSYRRAVPKRMKGEIRPRSAVDPAYARIYRYEQVIDIVKSAPAGNDRAQGIKLSVTVPELRAMFDGTETLIGIARIPWYTRQTLRP
jgi:hypothetical protein